MKHLLLYLFLFSSPLLISSQTIFITHSEPNPLICDVLSCDTLYVDYDVSFYKLLDYKDINKNNISRIIEVKLYDECGNFKLGFLNRKHYLKKTIIVYYSEWEKDKIINM